MNTCQTAISPELSKAHLVSSQAPPRQPGCCSCFNGKLKNQKLIFSGKIDALNSYYHDNISNYPDQKNKNAFLKDIQTQVEELVDKQIISPISFTDKNREAIVFEVIRDLALAKQLLPKGSNVRSLAHGTGLSDSTFTQFEKKLGPVGKEAFIYLAKKIDITPSKIKSDFQIATPIPNGARIEKRTEEVKPATNTPEDLLIHQGDKSRAATQNTTAAIISSAQAQIRHNKAQEVDNTLTTLTNNQAAENIKGINAQLKASNEAVLESGKSAHQSGLNLGRSPL